MQGFVFRYLKYNESWSLDFYFFLHIVFVPPNIYTTEVVISENLVGHFSVTCLAVLVKIVDFINIFFDGSCTRISYTVVDHFPNFLAIFQIQDFFYKTVFLFHLFFVLLCFISVYRNPKFLLLNVLRT